MTIRLKRTCMEQNNWEIYSLAGSKIIQIIIIIKIAVSLCELAHCSLQYREKVKICRL